MVRGEIQRRHGVAPQRLAVVRNGVDLEGLQTRRALAEAHGWDAHLAALRALFERVRP